jgi:nitrite reductase/ring-hydroxylating ferredoxin subunit
MDGLDRRQLMLGSLGLAGVPLCCTTPVVAPESVSFRGGILVLNLQKTPMLRQVGSAAALFDAPRKLNIIVARTEKHRFVALDRSCTHNYAQCTYNHKRRTVQCTSLNHAEYSLDGTLLHGRTHGNLRTYKVRYFADRLEITLEKEDEAALAGGFLLPVAAFAQRPEMLRILTITPSG